jgi:hypothetical protein
LPDSATPRPRCTRAICRDARPVPEPLFTSGFSSHLTTTIGYYKARRLSSGKCGGQAPGRRGSPPRAGETAKGRSVGAAREPPLRINVHLGHYLQGRVNDRRPWKTALSPGERASIPNSAPLSSDLADHTTATARVVTDVGFRCILCTEVNSHRYAGRFYVRSSVGILQRMYEARLYRGGRDTRAGRGGVADHKDREERLSKRCV